MKTLPLSHHTLLDDRAPRTIVTRFSANGFTTWHPDHDQESFLEKPHAQIFAVILFASSSLLSTSQSVPVKFEAPRAWFSAISKRVGAYGFAALFDSCGIAARSVLSLYSPPQSRSVTTKLQTSLFSFPRCCSDNVKCPWADRGVAIQPHSDSIEDLQNSNGCPIDESTESASAACTL